MRLILVGLLVLISCQKSTKKNAIVLKETEYSKPKLQQNLKAYCFYKLNDKYSTEKDSLTINNWLKETSKLIEKNNALESIFNQNGGGPIGAEWNPSTDLFIAILTPDNSPGNVATVTINGKIFKNKIYKYNPSLTWYRVNQNFWEKEIKKISVNDMEALFPSEILKGIKSGKYNSSIISDFGEILRFEFAYKEQKIIKFFHATYGE